MTLYNVSFQVYSVVYSWNPTITPSWRKVTPSEERERKMPLIVDTLFRDSARNPLGPIFCHMIAALSWQPKGWSNKFQCQSNSVFAISWILGSQNIAKTKFEQDLSLLDHPLVRYSVI